jgi:peptidoglycan hydrolase-like protein with peptidoglycan-binding domain
MSRVYLARDARGMLVTEAQLNLQRDGYYTGNIDAIYGGGTEKAVARFQEDRRLPMTGAFDGITWKQVMRRDPPSVFQRCLQVTAAFEGHGFGLIAGAWDGGWLTWGIIGFTLSSGSLGRVVLTTYDRNPEVVRQAFGNRTDELISMMQASPRRQKAWAESISVPPSNYRVVEPWRSAFMVFGKSPVVQAIQLQRAEQDYFVPAMKLVTRLELEEELGAGLCFDIQVQNGGINRKAAQAIQDFRDNNPDEDELTFRTIIADAVADQSNPKFKEDVRARKRTLATGAGTVHGEAYVMKQWGLDALSLEG